MNASPRDLQIESLNISTTLPMTYRHKPGSDRNLLILFLHGYADHGGSLIRRLFPDGWPLMIENTSALIPNGPFPVPVKTETGWRESYAWYFYSEKEAKMMITPETAARGCEDLISKFGYDETPKLIVGFSQGGYLAPYLAQKLKNVKEIVGISTGFRADYYPKSLDLRVTAIHGAEDEIFAVAEARQAHRRILDLGFSGDFNEVPKLGHSVNAAVGKLVEDRTKHWLS